MKIVMYPSPQLSVRVNTGCLYLRKFSHSVFPFRWTPKVIVNQFVFKLKYLISLPFWSSRNTIWCRFYYWLCLSKFQSKTLNCRRRIIRRQRRKRRRRRHVRHAEKGKEQTKRNFHLSPQLVVYTLALTANF